MNIIDKLFEKEVWEVFLEHKINQGNICQADADDLRQFIDNSEYLPVVKSIRNGDGFSAPEKILINKTKAGKKRTVYTFKRAEKYILKLIAFLLRDYDHLFSPNLYSFRKNSGIKKAVSNILQIPNLNNRYVYKVDISNYFNSVDIDIFLPKLEIALTDDQELFCFLKSLLKNPFVEYEGKLIEEKKGIMAGIPVASFFANLYLRELDKNFFDQKIPYVRYSDDILVFAKDRKELDDCIEQIKIFLHSHKLKANPEKEIISLPGEKWTFLGFSYQRGIIDISDVSFKKLKAKMKRKAKALNRWARKKNLPSEYAVRAFIKRFNAKLYDNPVYNELTWTRWFFPVINTSDTLRKIDSYMQECIRFLATEKRTKARFSFRYEEMKTLGYRNLVNEYYKFKDNKENE